MVGRDGGGAAEVAVFDALTVTLEDHQRNTTLQLTVLLANPNKWAGLDGAVLPAAVERLL
jgi:hypothetical protein